MGIEIKNGGTVEWRDIASSRDKELKWQSEGLVDRGTGEILAKVQRFGQSALWELFVRGDSRGGEFLTMEFLTMEQAKVRALQLVGVLSR